LIATITLLARWLLHAFAPAEWCIDAQAGVDGPAGTRPLPLSLRDFVATSHEFIPVSGALSFSRGFSQGRKTAIPAPTVTFRSSIDTKTG
jgi:hypothetical protein